MTENAKKFLEQVSKDEALKAEFQATQSAALNGLLKAKGLEGEAEKASNEAIVKFAAAHGVTLTADDLKPAKMEALSEDELKAVAGGASECGCAIVGTNMGAIDCYCLGGGAGAGSHGHSGACACSGGGYGRSFD